MKRKIILLFTLFFVFISRSFGQTVPEIGIMILSNDKIAEVNINQEKYVNEVGELVNLMKNEFVGISAGQKIAVLLISHNAGKPTIEFHASPTLPITKTSHFLSSARELNFTNTKFVNFCILLHINVTDTEGIKDFKELKVPRQKMEEEFIAADLKEKSNLLKQWAIKEVLPVLAAYETSVEDKFMGVKNFGKLVANTDFTNVQSSRNLTSANADYWRATMEMGLGNQLIPLTKIMILVSQGEFDYAMKYLEVLQMVSDPKTVANEYFLDLTWKLKVFNEQLNTAINKGITAHDKGKFDQAILAYNDILTEYPNSAWALYEKYYSQNALDLKGKKIERDDRIQWDQAKVKIYASNPLYHMDVRASNAKEGYLLYRRNEIPMLFKNQKEQLSDFYKYADIAMDLGIYDFAAQLFWASFSFGKSTKENALNKYLYCLDKLGVKDVKTNFKGNFDQVFDQIEKDKEKEMKDHAFYKSFKQ